MSLFRLVAIFAIAAIVNPICCCYSVANEVDESVSDHGCCELSREASSENKGAGEHNPEKCQHMAEREAQISQSIESSASLVKHSHSFLLDSGDYVGISWQSSQSERFTKAISAPVPIPETPLNVAYCVYLI